MMKAYILTIKCQQVWLFVEILQENKWNTYPRTLNVNWRSIIVNFGFRRDVSSAQRVHNCFMNIYKSIKRAQVHRCHRQEVCERWRSFYYDTHQIFLLILSRIPSLYPQRSWPPPLPTRKPTTQHGHVTLTICVIFFERISIIKT